MPWPKGKKRSPETRRKMREAHLRRLEDPSVRREMEENLALGREFWRSPEGRARAAENLRLARTGAVASPETREKVAATNRGKLQGEELRARRAESLRRAYEEGRRTPPADWVSGEAGRRNLGNVMSVEERARMSAAQTARFARNGGYHFPETLERMREKRAEQPATWRSSLEVEVSGLLDALGIRYERNRYLKELGRHQWDFILRERGILLEVDGCYWHGCDLCGFPGIPGRRENDAELTNNAERAGWRVIRMKEHEVRSGEAALKLVS
jgi:DNA mismatch endonuclease, patch repair protein